MSALRALPAELVTGVPARVALVGLVVLLSPALSAAEQTKWPPLGAVKFIKGRPAKDADVAAGNAVFVARAGGIPVGKPIAMVIPQYAYHVDPSSKPPRLPVIIVQAELAQGQKLVGYREVSSGEPGIGLLEEFELLGTAPPR